MARYKIKTLRDGTYKMVPGSFVGREEATNAAHSFTIDERAMIVEIHNETCEHGIPVRDDCPQCRSDFSS